MSNTEERTWESSFQSRPRLSPEEAHRVVVLRQRLNGLRYLSSEYLLRRAKLSPTKGQRNAWESVWALLVFVEHQKRFPRQGELYPYLHKVLDESNTLEDLQLPELDSFELEETQESYKMTLESLVGENLVLRDWASQVCKKIDWTLSSLIQNLATGTWVVISYDPNSPACQDSLSVQKAQKSYQDMASKLKILRDNCPSG